MTKLSVTIAGAVEMTGIGRTSLDKLIAAGKIDARKEGARTLILADSLRQHIEALPKVEAA